MVGVARQAIQRLNSNVANKCNCEADGIMCEFEGGLFQDSIDYSSNEWFAWFTMMCV
jgi:hypothetical protein